MLFILLTIMITGNLYSQYPCEIENESADLPRSEITNKYIPDAYTPIMYIKVSFHFMMKSDSTLNFTSFDDGNGNCNFSAYEYSDVLISYANSMLSQNSQMHLPLGNDTPVLQRKYRLKLENILFHYNDNAYTYNSLSNSFINNYSINSGSEVNVFFVYDDAIEGYSGGGKANMFGNRHVIIKAAWQKYVDGGGNGGFWGDAWVLVHETGHSLGLEHTMHHRNGRCCNQNDNCDDGCSDTPTLNEIIESGQPNPCPSWGDEGATKSNNIMDYSGLQAITPEQLGIIHYTITHDMFPYIYNDYCEINYNESEYVIEEGQNLIWTNDRILKNSLIIEGGSQLIIKDCSLHIPGGASIIVWPGGRLIVDGGTITNRCGRMWAGIEVWGDNSVHQNAEGGVYRQGYVELKNGAVIENAECALALWHPGDWSSTGGIVHATGAEFRNNAKTVHALYYGNYDPGTGREASYNAWFRRCTFTVDGDYAGGSTRQDAPSR